MADDFPPGHRNMLMTVDDYLKRGSSLAIYINQLVEHRRNGRVPDEVRLFANHALELKKSGVASISYDNVAIVGERVCQYPLNAFSPIAADLIRAGVALYTGDRRTGIRADATLNNDGLIMPTEKQVLMLTHFMSSSEIGDLVMHSYNCEKRDGATMYNNPLPKGEKKANNIRMAVLAELVAAGHLPEWMMPLREVQS